MTAGKTHGDDIFPLPMPIIGDGGRDDYFLMKVDVHDSARCPGIESGDWLIVREQQVAADGDLVAVMVDGKSAVRPFERMDDDGWTLIGKVAHVLHRVGV